jgi:hypothetical protein
MRQVLSVMQRRPMAAAKVRQEVRLEGQELIGAGQYWQQGVGAERRSRWQLQTHVAGETASLVQVFDSRYVWTDRKLPDSRRVARIDMVRLRRQLNASASRDRDTSALAGEELTTALAAVQGGLPQLLWELAEQFVFDPPQTVRRDEGGRYLLVGRWKPGRLAALWPEAAEPTADLKSVWPAQLPHHVVLEVGLEDLFPRVLEYRTADDASLADGPGAAATPLARYEWFDVAFLPTIDPRQFVYATGEIDWVDETEQAAADLLASLQAASP